MSQDSDPVDGSQSVTVEGELEGSKEKMEGSDEKMEETHALDSHTEEHALYSGKPDDEPAVTDTTLTKIPDSPSSVNAREDDMDDLFGDEQLEEDARSGNEDDYDSSARRPNMELDDEEAEEHAMYTRKFYGEDAVLSDNDDIAHSYKEENIELVRDIVPYKVNDKPADNNMIYYAKVPGFLNIDPVPFDPENFKALVEERIARVGSTREDHIGDSLIDEHTVRWRYSKDSEQRVFKQSNSRIVKWSDGTYSLKLGEEYTDILINDIDNTFLAVSHDAQELMQCCDGGKITNSMMFIPTSTNSKLHQKLSQAVASRKARVTTGPGRFIIQKDPELEKKELEKRQGQIFRERRKRRLAEEASRDSPDAADHNSSGFALDRGSGYGRGHGSREDEYEEDDFLVDDDDVEEEEEEDDDDNNRGSDGLSDEEERSDTDQEDANAKRLTEVKRQGASKYTDEDQESQKRRKIAVIDDEDDE